MKTTIIDSVLIGTTLSFLLLMTVGTVYLIPLDAPYFSISHLIIGLIVYFFYTALYISIVRKIKPLPQGTFDFDSWEFTYWKYMTVISAAAEKTITPFEFLFTKGLFFKILGVHLGKDAAFPVQNTIRDHSLVHIGAMAIIGEESVITAHTIFNKTVYIAPVIIGENAVVGINSVVMPGVSIGKNSILAPGAVAVPDTIIPENEFWGGIPAKHIKKI